MSLAAGGVDQKALLADLKPRLKALEDDLRERSGEPEFEGKLRPEYDRAKEAERTAATYETWREDRITQAAVAWLLGCVYVRFCEDNGLIPEPFLAGPGDALATAEARHVEFFTASPHLNDRDWLVEAFTHLADAHPTAAGLFDHKYNPLWELTPSFDAASALLAFWRRRGPDGEIVHDFTDEDWNTRFLGDLYQDLSDHAKKTYALLQTPDFVEEFILDLTLTPALDEFGLEPKVEVHREGGGVDRELHGLRTIDPACGSGHFLLGIFHRVLDEWRKISPGVDDWTLIRRSLESVHGCDKNAFAASIARFRLLVAAMKAGRAVQLHGLPEFPINVAVGDSLMHGHGVKGEQMDMLTSDEAFTYRTEDVNEYIASCDLLTPATYHVVVGNPPYITVKDSRENANYRERWKTCAGAYALSVPFAERLFHLATRNGCGGAVGQITSNSFMKREFGKKLIEQFFPVVELTHVVDTSGAYIPGHGTPTVILVGRKRYPSKDASIRAVLSVRGEPNAPARPEEGKVWSAISGQTYGPESESEWISTADYPRTAFANHPWSLSGGGAAEVQDMINATKLRLKDVADSGFRAITGLDEVFVQPPHTLAPVEAPTRPYITGEDVRDFGYKSNTVIYPYDGSEGLPVKVTQHMWPWRTNLRERRRFGIPIADMEKVQWWELREFYPRRFTGDPVIVFSFVATHNHFSLERHGSVANRAAPVIQLNKREEGEDGCLELLGVLNSSTACFWLKQVCHNKGSQGVNEGFKSQEWERFYEFTGTKLQEYPIPANLPFVAGRELDRLAWEVADHESSAVAAQVVPTRDRLDAAHAKHKRIQGRMIAVQEELDWEVYQLYCLLTDDEARELRATADDVPELALGERAFEIVMARRMAAGELETAWFTRHGSTPITELPAHWPESYKRVVEKRIETIEKRKDIALIERPECKRRWASESWEKKEKAALENWLLDKCESKDLWFSLRDGLTNPRTLTVSQLADLLRADEDVNSVAALYAADHLGKRDLPLAQVLEQVLATEHVPYLAAMRYKDSGLRKRAQWEDVWEQQREEDRTGGRLDIPVPPKYTSADFRKTSYWSHRGKLDVPKERFISYLGASPDADPTLLLGWAGWDHKDQAQALVNLVNDRIEQAGWGTDKITPLLAGLAEVLPWVRQWHGEYDDDWGGNPAEEYQTYLDSQRAKHQLTADALGQWRLAPVARGRKKS